MIIYANFSPDFYNEIFQHVKFFGIKRTEQHLMNLGYGDSFVKAFIKKIIKNRGW